MKVLLSLSLLLLLLSLLWLLLLCIQVCVIHPKAQLQPPTKASMYAKGHSPGAEECGQYARFGYDADAARDYGMPMRVAKRLGQLWQPWYEDMLQQAGLQGRQSLPSQHQTTTI